MDGGTYPLGYGVTVCATNNLCYAFVDWTDQNSNVLSTSACYPFTTTNSETLVANFTPTAACIAITTTSVPTGAGSTSGGGAVGSGASVTVCATNNPCYAFADWTDQNSNIVSTTNCYTFTAVSNETLAANFTPITYSISTGSSPSAGGSTSGGGTVPCGSNVTVCATANPSYSFVNWTDQNSNVVSWSACYTSIPSGNANLTANFTQTETTLYSFVGYPTDGANPSAAVVRGSDGNFYGTTEVGGTHSLGTVFRISPSGAETTLYSFAGSPNDGAYPYAALVQGSNGNFYGTTYEGGTYNFGTVFRISPSGTETTLYSFAGSPYDGANPQAALVQGSDGNFYGTTYYGGGHNAGTVFRISPGGTETTLYNFGNYSADGRYPKAALVQGSNGNFYGTTYYGGTYNYGTVFQISPSGSYSVAYSFQESRVPGAPPIGAYPNGLVQGSNGNFYGTTVAGGQSAACGSPGCGSVFRVTSNGTYTVLYSFSPSVSVGVIPHAGLVQGSDGNFYGTTYYGGPHNSGTVFRVSPSGSYTSLYSLVGYPSDGGNPAAGLVQGNDGNFYGTTYDGGTNQPSPGAGTVFRIDAGLCAYGITASSAPAEGGLTSGAGVYSCGSTTSVTVCASPNACYGFVNWTDQNSNVLSTSACYTFTATNSEALVANFTPNAVSIGTSSSPVDGGSTSGGGMVACGSNVTVCASPNASCYSFVNWTDQNGNVLSTTNYYTFSAVGNETLVANFTPTTYSVSTSSSPIGGGSTSGGGTVACGSSGPVCASPNPCYSFVNWTDQNSNVLSTSACYVLTVTTNATLVANFTFAPTNYTITTSSSPSAGGSASGGGTVACGSNVTVCASANACYSFANWTDRNGYVLSTSACYTFTADGDETLVANFTLVDSVGDGILDSWRAQYFGGSGTTTNSQSCATCDADGTGQNNLFKYVAGLDPTNPASVFVLSITSATSPLTQMNLLFNPLATGRTYTPLFSTDLVSGAWLPLTTYTGPVTNNNNQATITDTNPIPTQEFYRIEISLP
jgi:uncharacterized repeat protein (TIGR03803 family)